MTTLPALPRFASAAQIGVLTLRVNPLRTALSTLGVIMGVGSVVSVLSLADGVESFARDQVARTTDLQMVAVVPRSTRLLDGILVPRSDVATFEPADVAALGGAAPEAKTVILARSGGTVAQRDSGAAPRGVTVTALVSSRIADPPALAAGVFLADTDLAGDRRLALLTRSAADSLAPGRGNALVGTPILLRGLPFTVVGVLAPRTPDGLEVYVPWRAAEAVLSSSAAERAPAMRLIAGNVDSVPAMVKHVEAWSASRFGPLWQDRLEVRVNTVRLQQFAQSMLVFKLLMGAITGISLVVGGIGIMNVLLAAVAERTREIGIRKAVGARRRDVITQFLAESLAITSAGSAVGLGLGFVVAITTAAIMRQRTGAHVHAELGWNTVLVAAGAAVAVGLTFGIYPALRAARLSPVDAIRHE